MTQYLGNRFYSKLDTKEIELLLTIRIDMTAFQKLG